MLLPRQFSESGSLDLPTFSPTPVVIMSDTAVNTALPTTPSPPENSPTNNAPNSPAPSPSPAPQPSPQPSPEPSPEPQPSPEPSPEPSTPQPNPQPSPSQQQPSPSNNNPAPTTPPSQPPSNPTTPSNQPQPTPQEPNNPEPAPETTQNNPEDPVVTVVPTDGAGSTSTFVTTVITSNDPTGTGALPTGIDPTNTSAPNPNDPQQSTGDDGKLGQAGTIAVAVVVPIAVVTLILVAAFWWWRKRKASKASEAQRKQELDDYTFNPHADPTVPAVGMASESGTYELKDDTSGYRGWGTTTSGSVNRQPSTTLSGGVGVPGSVSDLTNSPPRGHPGSTRSGDALMENSYSPEPEILGAMGPSAAATRAVGVQRGPSNASSSYSTAGRSEASDGIGVAYGGTNYYEQYNTGNPYDNSQEAQQQRAMAADTSGQPIIRDNPARRNARIESPSHFPQQSAGISQNF